MGAEQVHVLRFLTGKYAGEEFPLTPNKRSYIVGRSSDVDLMLADDSVSRKHARFYAERGMFWLRDLGSRNGTLVNGDRTKRHCLREGDKLVIGSSLIGVVMSELSKVKTGWAGERTRQDSGKSMSGSLSDIPIVDVLQWLATSRKSGTLNVNNAADEIVGKIYLRDGNAFFSTIGDNEEMDPEKALLRMLTWEKGTFGLDNTTYEGEPKKSIKASLNHILMESARIADELEHLAERKDIPRYKTEVKLVKPGPVRWKTLEDDDMDMVQDFAEGKSWAQILDFSEGDDLSLTKRVLGLKKRGVVEW